MFEKDMAGRPLLLANLWKNMSKGLFADGALPTGETSGYWKWANWSGGA